MKNFVLPGTPKIFLLMLEKVLKDKSLINNDLFFELLCGAAQEWSDFCSSLNQGHSTEYNICQSGAAIERIRGGVMASRYHLSREDDTNWEELYENVKHFTKICDHEIRENVYLCSPHDERLIESPMYERYKNSELIS